ncbi:MAG: adenosylmethionine decarboxylase [Candidatus Wildermuthbacteria bacterium]|nr:adenosylmethionine decarboxylase [Candidatus Wildermuthbacteria bacterium]
MEKIKAQELDKRAPRWRASNRNIDYAGIHIVADFWDCKMIEDEKELKVAFYEAARIANSKPLSFSVYKFSPQGITAVLLLSESHIAIHTWPEIGYIALDIFTCGERSQPMKALEYFRALLEPQEAVVREIKRGESTGTI